MKREPVHQGRLKSPFYSRLEKLDFVNQWHEWKGYSSSDELYCADTEYFAIRNATAVFDLSPMTKYRITGPDALEYLNPRRIFIRDDVEFLELGFEQLVHAGEIRAGRFLLELIERGRDSELQRYITAADKRRPENEEQDCYLFAKRHS